MRAASMVMVAALALATGAAGVAAQDGGPDPVVLETGRLLVESNCGGCHATGRTGDSPHPQAPPFRLLHERYDVTDLSEALVEGLVSGHPDMPEFTFDPQDAEAIVAWLKSLE